MEAMSLIDINTKEAEKKLSVVRRYGLEIIFVLLVSAIGYIYVQQAKINSTYLEYLRSDSKVGIEKISENTQVLREIKEVLIGNQAYLKSIQSKAETK